MKIIEAMKQIKDLQRKAEDLRQKAVKYGADVDIETPTYGTVEQQRAKLAEWAQAHGDLLKEILRLRVAIQRTNLATAVAIELNGTAVTKTIAEWIHRRRELAKLEGDFFAQVQQRASQLNTGRMISSAGETREVQVRRYFDQAAYDTRIEALRSEPMTIDATLEVTNAVTDLIEA